jgi:hypothetical protein
VAETILAKMAVQIAANTAEFNKALNQTSAGIKSFQNNLIGAAATIGVAFGIKEVGQFAFEVSKLAGEAKGVEAAFGKFSENQVLMERLKLATSDTVSELELMKRTVQAANFGISLEALPKLLEFATVRAQQTGQSVDYLVDSIVTGIGRKSPLILDNLGISATALKAKLGGVSLEAAGVGKVAEAVGAIASEELKKMGGASDNAATDIQKLNAAWTNFQVSVGKGLNTTGVFSGVVSGITDLLNDFSGENKLVNAVESLGTAFNAGQKDATGFLKTVEDLEKEFGKGNLAITVKDLENITKNMKNSATVTEQLKDRLAELGIQIIGLNETPLGPDLFTKWAPNIPPAITSLDSLQIKIKELNDQFETTDVTDKKKLANIGQQILATQAQVAALEELRKKQEQIGAPTTKFGKEQAANAAVGIKETEFTDFSKGTPDTSGLTQIPDITEKMDGYVEQVERGKASLQEWGIQMGITADSQEAQFQKQTASAIAYGDAIGNAIATSIQGQESAAQSLKRVTTTIIQQFLRQALGAIIASAAKSGGPPPVAIALAAAGVAVISAMFSKIGGSGGGGSVGSVSTRPATQNAERNNRLNPDGIRVDFNAEFVMRGNDMVAVVDRTNVRNGRLNG